MNVLTDKLNLKYPIIQGGMANIATAEFAASVSKAGGLGLIGAGGWNRERVESEIIKIKELLDDEPFGVNIMLMSPFAKDIIELCYQYQVPVVTTGAGSPKAFIKQFQEHGILVFPVVPNAKLAKKMEVLGADAVIVEGTESGGHVGEETTLVAVSQAVELCNIPVIAAGGIANNSQFEAVRRLGAIGVQIGTVLLTTDECPIHQNYKDIIVNAEPGDTLVTGRMLGAPVRTIKTPMTKKYVKLEKTDISHAEIEKLTLGSLSKAVFDGNFEEGSFMAGQVAGQIKEIKPVKEVLADLTKIS